MITEYRRPDNFTFSSDIQLLHYLTTITFELLFFLCQTNSPFQHTFWITKISGFPPGVCTRPLENYK